MHHLDIGEIRQRYRTVGQRSKPLKILWSQLIACPYRRSRGHGIEVVKTHESCGSLVVIAAHKDVADFTRTLGDFVGARPIADDVPKVDDQVKGRSSREAGIESFPVGMNVAE